MKEISEKLRNTIISAIPTDNLVLCYLPLYGTSPTIIDRVLAANNGTFTNPKWKTLKNGLVVPSYDGTAYIKNSTANWRSGDSQGAIGVWFKVSTSSTIAALFASSDEASVSRYLMFRVGLSNRLIITQRDNDTADLVYGNTYHTINKWYFAFVTSDGSSWAIYLNGVAETMTISTGANTGDWFADTSARDNFSIGALVKTTVSNYCTGQIGLVVVYSVAPTPTQILQMFNRLKGVFH